MNFQLRIEVGNPACHLVGTCLEILQGKASNILLLLTFCCLSTIVLGNPAGNCYEHYVDFYQPSHSLILGNPAGVGNPEGKGNHSTIIDSLTHHLSTGRSIPVSQDDRKKAIALSVLLPGLGEQYLGDRNSGVSFFVIEGCIWGSFLGLRWFSNILKNDYILYSISSSGAYKGGDENYYNAVEWFASIDAYNERVRENARALYRNDIRKQQEYIQENSYSDSLAWRWENKSEWNKYIGLREQRRDLLHKAGYCVGAAILNRLVSAFIVSQKQEKYGFIFEPRGVKLYFSLYH